MTLKPLFIALITGLMLQTSVQAQTVDSLNLGGFDPSSGRKASAAAASDAGPNLKQAKAAALHNASQMLHASNNPVGGNPDGSVSIVEFFDYQCHHCVDMDPKINTLIKSNPDLRIVYKEFPIRGAVSEFAAKAALAANLQGKYFPLHEALMKASESLSEAKVIELAKSVGLDTVKLKAAIESPEVTGQIAENYHLAQSMGINGTPAFFISKTASPSEASSEVVMGQVDEDYLQKILNKMNH